MLRITQVMKDQGRMRSWLADQIGVTPGHVTRLLGGEQPWTEERKGRAVVALGWPVEQTEELFSEVDRAGELVVRVVDPMAVLRRCRGAGVITVDEFDHLVEMVKLG